MKIVKEYYRLSELERFFGITVDDINYLAEQNKIRLALDCKLAKFLIGDWPNYKDKPSEFVGYGVVEYKGLIDLAPHSYEELQAKGEISVSTTKLLNKEAVFNWSGEYPYKTLTPHDEIERWEPKMIQDITFDALPAKFFPIEGQHPMRAMHAYGREISHQIGSMFSGKSWDDSEKEEIAKPSELDKYPELQVSEESVNFTCNDIRILHDTALEAVRMLTGTVTAVELPSKPKNQLPKKSRNTDLHDLIQRIILKRPSYSAKDIWAAIEADFAIDEGEREFDDYNILRDVSATEILWESRYGTGGTLKFSSLSPTVSKVKKKLFNS